MKAKEDGFRGARLRKSYMIQIALFTLLVLSIFIAAVYNAVRLNTAIDGRTYSYVTDVTTQLAADINNRIERCTRDLVLLEGGLVSMGNYEDSDALKDYLKKSAQTLGFDSLLFVSPEGQVYASETILPDVAILPGIQDSLNGKNGVSFLDQQSIIYSIPLHSGDQIVGALAGVRSKENMQKLIQPQSFGGSGLTCISDITGEVVISPTNLEPFLRLDDIFDRSSDSKTVQDIRKMQEDMKAHRSGVFSFSAVDGTELILSYHVLDAYDWVLLTLVPDNLLSHETNRYIFWTYVIIVGLALIFVLFYVVMIFVNREHRKQMERIAFTDFVTGGMNQAAFQFQCGELIQSAPPGTYTVVSLNIKNFKLINEGFGSAAGDKTLRYVARILGKNLKKGELSARVEADNYMLCLRENDTDVIRERLKKTVAEINTFNVQRKQRYYFTILQGAYIVTDNTQEITVIQDRAKTACRSQRELDETDCVFYDAAFTQRLKKEHELNSLFAEAIVNKEFEVYLQPKILLESEKIGGAEALVRWCNPQRGMIYPSDFIPVFEQSGKICRLDLYVFEEVCALLARWSADGRTPLLPISVNLSRQHFKEANFLQEFADIAKRYGIPAGTIELELTESVFFEEQMIEVVKESICQMHELGFLCSLDDFGAGFSSLGLLKEFDVDTVKLDRRFFKNIEEKKAQEVVICIVELAKRLGIHTVAEGIETKEQLMFLRDAGCDLLQGYLYAKPMPIQEFEAWEDAFKKENGPSY